MQKPNKAEEYLCSSQLKGTPVIHFVLFFLLIRSKINLPLCILNLFNLILLIYFSNFYDNLLQMGSEQLGGDSR